jgi:hypothetical protein
VNAEGDGWVNWSELATLLTGFRKSVAESLEHLLVLTSHASDRVLREFARGTR